MTGVVDENASLDALGNEWLTTDHTIDRVQ